MTGELDLWIYDVSRENDNIWLWALDSDGVNHILEYRGFKNYFYIDPEAIDYRRISEILIEHGLHRELSIERDSKKIYGKYRDLYRVSGPDRFISRIIPIFRRVVGEDKLFEDDIRISNKFLLVRGIHPCSWYRVSVSGEAAIKYINPKLEGPIDRDGWPRLRTVSIDIIAVSRLGEPNPDIDIVNYIVLYDGNRYYEYVAGRDDRDVIHGFVSKINEVDPNIIASFGGNSFIWPYLSTRANRYGMGLGIGYKGRDIHQSLYGHYSIIGRINIDLKDYVDDLPVLQLKTLEELAVYHGLATPARSIDQLSYSLYWERYRDDLINYVRWRVKAIYDITLMLLDHIFTLSSITGIPPDYVLTSSSGRQAEHYIMGKALRVGEVIPKVIERRMPSYPGGMVLKPRRGIHRDICVIDFKSMYPNIIMKHNISPDTVSREPIEGGEYYREEGIWVRRDTTGIIPSIIRILVDERGRVLAEMGKLPKTSPRYRILDARQRILKILANTMYGYMGWIGARWYSREGALLITSIGRKIIESSISKAKDLGLEVIYGDTDSLFVRYDEDKVGKLIGWVEKELGMEAKIDAIYEKILFTEAKKRYAGITIKGYIDIVGLEYVRRDWCNLARRAQYDVIKEILGKCSREKIINIFRGYVDRLRSRRFEIDELIIWEQITRPLNEYKAISPHIAVARTLESRGWRVKRGTFIGYIILKGEGPLYKRAVHYLDADPDEIDIDYYINNQLIPVVARVARVIGISEKYLEDIAKSGFLGLDRFLGGG